MRAKCVLITVTALFTVSIPASLSHAKIDPKTIAGMWLLDDTVNNVVEDSSGNGNNGTVFGKPTLVDGKFSKALHFDGASDWIQVKDSPSLHFSTEVTLMCWIKPERYAFPGTQ
jgi:hypothetical protein